MKGFQMVTFIIHPKGEIPRPPRNDKRTKIRLYLWYVWMHIIFPVKGWALKIICPQELRELIVLISKNPTTFNQFCIGINQNNAAVKSVPLLPILRTINAVTV